MIEIYNIRSLQSDVNIVEKLLQKINSTTDPVPHNRLSSLLSTLRDDLIVTVEYDYVDATFRDEYYRFYATKYRNYGRNCAKMSFFEPGAITPGSEIDYSKADKIKEKYLGFVVLRPINACIGRNVISPRAKKAPFSDISICKTNVNTTAVGLKVSVSGFPHSSQDGEMMACAETALWSIAEYFGHKYPNHKPVAPTEILEAMRPSSHKRQLPSKGLTFMQIAEGLKTFGFSPEIYTLYDHTTCSIDKSMKEVFTCYIESGFPLAICLQGSKIGHAIVCIGKKTDSVTRHRND